MRTIRENSGQKLEFRSLISYLKRWVIQKNECTPGSMNGLFGDFFWEIWRGIFRGGRDYLVDLGSFLKEK